MKFVFAAAVALAFSMAGSALAQSSPAAPAAASTPAVKTAANDKPKHGSPDEVICRRQQVTGSMMDKAVCMTRRDWQEAEGADAQADTVLLHGQPLQPDK